jgi:hypothetical protein
MQDTCLKANSCCLEGYSRDECLLCVEYFLACIARTLAIDVLIASEPPDEVRYQNGLISEQQHRTNLFCHKVIYVEVDSSDSNLF